MRRAAPSAGYNFRGWGGIARGAGHAAWLGYAVIRRFNAAIIAATTAVAAGAILAMLVDTMVPEAYEQAGGWTGLITALGFLAAFALSRAGG